MNTKSIISILTLRYDFTLTPILPNLHWKDFYKKQEFTHLEIRELISKNLKEQIPYNYDGPISISLSGGIDSTLALCILKDNFPDNQIDAISIKFSNSMDETEIASKIAKEIGVEHHIFEIENFLQMLPEAISITKRPFWDTHWLYVVKNAKKFSKYLISGDGGDELFGGYTFRYKKFLSQINSKSGIHDKISSYLSCHERDHVPEQEKIFSKKLNFNWNIIFEKLRPFFDNPLSPLDQVMLADYNGKLLYNFSIINSSLAKNYNLKSITPLLSEELIRKTPKIPINNKFDLEENNGKLLLKKILNDFKLDKFISHEKLGFSVNTENLWKNYGFDMANEYLTDSLLVQDDWIEKNWIKSNLHSKELDVRHINKLLGILALEIWYRNKSIN